MSHYLRFINIFVGVACIFLLPLNCAKDATDQDLQGDEGYEDGSTSSPVLLPEYIDITAQVGDEYSLSFYSELDWRINSTAEWIEFYDNDGDRYTTLVGSGSNVERSVTFVINDYNHTFNYAESTISISIDGTPTEVAKVVRTGRVASIIFNSSETIIEDMLEVEWSSDLASFSANLNFTTNFDWVINGIPAWLVAANGDDIICSGSSFDTFDMDLTTNYEFYSLSESMSAEITVTSPEYPDVAYALSIVTSGAKGMMQILENPDALDFSSEGTQQEARELRYIVESQLQDIAPYAVACYHNADGSYSIANDEPSADSWIHTQIDEINHYGAFISEVSCEVWLSENIDTESRSAALFILPTSIVEEYLLPAGLFDESGVVRSELSRYLVGYVNQSGREIGDEDDEDVTDDGLTQGDSILEFTDESLVSGSVSLAVMDSDHPYFDFYSNQYFLSSGAMYILQSDEKCSPEFKMPFEYVWGVNSIFCVAAESDNDDWLSVDIAASTFIITMSSEVPASGCVVLMQDSDAVLLIHCEQL